MKISRILSDERGLTLPEVMAAVLILSIVTVSLYAVYDYSFNSYKWGGDYANNQDQGRLVLQKITGTVRKGFDIHTVTGEDGFLLDVLTDCKLFNSFDDNRIWTGRASGEFAGNPPTRDKDRFTINMQAGVAGSVYQLETTAPFALVKPTVKGHIQVEAKINASSLKPGSAAFLYLVGPKQEGDATLPNDLNYVGVRLTGAGELSIVDNVYGLAGTVYSYPEHIDLNREHIIRLSLQPRGYNDLSHWITLYLDNVEKYREEKDKSVTWTGENNLAFVRLGLAATENVQDTGITFTGLSLFYNSDKYYSRNEELFYQKNEETELQVAGGIKNFRVNRDANLADIELTFKNADPNGKQNSSYTLRSSITFQGR